MSRFLDAKNKRILGAGAALAGVVLAFAIGSAPAQAEWVWDGYGHREWVEHRYYHHEHYAPPVVYGPPVVYERPVYAPPVVYGAPGINVTIPLR